MSRIRILRQEVANRIAAGEVVERPASVLKELVDNAVDAGATRIAVTVEGAGVSLIQVADNGSGMDADDALQCLEQHATSKISEFEDLEKLLTCGFRGEAIPSIASVSRFTIITRPHDALEGSKVVVDGGTVREVSGCGCPPGTTMSVRQLFYNVPARRKFLRSPETEEGHIVEQLHLLALSRQDIHFTLSLDGRQALNLPPGDDLRQRAAELYGRDTVKDMLPVAWSEEGIAVSGLISRPGVHRSTRKEQRNFVNRRPVDSLVLSGALRDAYDSLVPKGRFPPALIFVSLAPERVDFNVHPAKREIRFREAPAVQRVVLAALQQALRGIAGAAILQPPSFLLPQSADSARPKLSFAPVSPPAQLAPPASALPAMPAQAAKAAEIAPISQIRPIFALPASALPASAPPASPAPVLAPTPPKTPATPTPPNHGLSRLRLLGPVRDRYVAAVGEGGLVLISLQAARERILFERLLNSAKMRQVTQQPLLIPITLEVPSADSALLKRAGETLATLGFDISPFGGNTWLLAAVPACYPQENLLAIFRNLVDDLRDNPDSSSRRGVLDEPLAAAAARAAARAHQPLDDASLRLLLQELDRCELPYAAPDGRPVLVHLSDSELARRFGR